MRQDKRIIQHMIEVIQNEGVNLTQWEEEFMDSIYERWKQYQNVTDRQEEIIERIYAERTP